jgi:heme exporter protein C
LLLWFLYAAYLILRQYSTGERRATLSAVLAIAGVPTMILNHFAVTLFQAYHPRAVVARPDGPAMAGSFVAALLLSVLAYTLIYAWLVAERLRLERLRSQLARCAARSNY